MYVALTSDTLTDGELYRYGTTQSATHQHPAGRFPGEIYGVKGAIRIKVDPGKLASRNMTFDELAAAIKAGTSYAGAGQFDGKNKSFTLRPQGQSTTRRAIATDRKTRGRSSPVYCAMSPVSSMASRTSGCRATSSPAALIRQHRSSCSPFRVKPARTR